MKSQAKEEVAVFAAGRSKELLHSAFGVFQKILLHGF